MSLQNKVVLVTGGSMGIGKAIAALAIEKGAKVAITGRNKERLDAAAKEIGALAICADVAKAEDVARTYEELLAEFGTIDVLVNNAGFGKGWDMIEDVNMDDFRAVYDVNVFGAAMMTQPAAKIFKEKKSGDIVNIASTAGLKGFARGTVYASSKFALRGMTECWRAEMRPHNVRVFLVNPSEVRQTAFNKTNGELSKEEDNKLTPTEIAHAIVAMLEMETRGLIPELSVWATNPW